SARPLLRVLLPRPVSSTKSPPRKGPACRTFAAPETASSSIDSMRCCPECATPHVRPIEEPIQSNLIGLPFSPGPFPNGFLLRVTPFFTYRGLGPGGLDGRRRSPLHSTQPPLGRPGHASHGPGRPRRLRTATFWAHLGSWPIHNCPFRPFRVSGPVRCLRWPKVKDATRRAQATVSSPTLHHPL